MYRLYAIIVRVAHFQSYRKHVGSSTSPYPKSSDVTVVVPTLHPTSDFKTCLQSWLLNDPHEIIVATDRDSMRKTLEIVADSKTDKVRVIEVGTFKKREKLVAGISQAKTAVITLNDDDTVWGPNFLSHMLCCFGDPSICAVRPPIYVRPINDSFTFWESLGSARNTSIVFNATVSAQQLGFSTMIQCTTCYRAPILQDQEFLDALVNEKWLSNYPLQSGDESFISRWLQRKGRRVAYQNCPETELWTTAKPDASYLRQLIRWTRADLRHGLRTAMRDRSLKPL